MKSRRQFRQAGKWTHRRSRSARPRRQGAVLLVVLSLLVLFVLIGVTFAVVATQHKNSAKGNARPAQLRYQPRKALDTAIYQLLRGTNDTNSSLVGQSLLRDLYGNDGVMGTVTSSQVDGTVAGQFVEIRFNPVALVNQPFNKNFAIAPGYYNGSVLTMLNGPAASHSTRVTSYDPTNGILRVEAFDSDGLATPIPAAGNVFLINGKPFNGMGAGFEPTTGGLTRSDGINPQNLVSILPHWAGYKSLAGLNVDQGGTDESYDAVDFQNPYLAMVSRQTSLGTALQRVIPSFHRPSLVNYWRNNPQSDPTQNVFPHTSPNAPGGRFLPATINSYREFRRKFIFRPMPWDHPNFSGSNPAMEAAGWNRGPDMEPGIALFDDDFDGTVDNATELGAVHSDDYPLNDGQLMNNLVNGRIWDVDNDGDGTADSIWLDIGLPLRTSSDGRKYKPLVAIMVKDMDGRLNLNAHGQLAHLPNLNAALGTIYGIINPGADGQPGVAMTDDDNNGTPDDATEFMWPGSDDYYQTTPYNFSPNYARPVPGTTPLAHARGRGRGPAETVFAHLFRPLLEANAITQSRYGNDGGAFNVPGRVNGRDDLLSFYGTAGLPNNFKNTATPPSRWGTRNDQQGRAIYGVDFTGHPLFGYAGLDGATQDDPYEFNPMQNVQGYANGRDNPYTVAELETLLRLFDVDANQLPLRLASLARLTFVGDPAVPGTMAGAPRNRSLFTVHSSHIPAPRSIFPRELRPLTTANRAPGSRLGTINTDGTINPVSIIDLYEERIRLINNNTQTPAQAIDILRQVAPFEFSHGQLFDINRVFGNGEDSNNDGTVDNAIEFANLANPEKAWPLGIPIPNPVPVAATGINSSENDDPLLGTRPGYPTVRYYARRHAYARHLYCLMLLLAERNMEHPAGPEMLPVQQRRELMARRIAQWVVNVIDFRDADSAMSWFEYDINPWNGWHTDGNILTSEYSNQPDGVFSGLNGGQPPVVERRVVWGCEAQDVVIGETISLHDRRVKDHDMDAGGQMRRHPTDMNRDDDLDQWRIPQGSLFIELYNTRTKRVNNERLPGVLYNQATGRLNLAFVHPNNSPYDGRQHPLWRIAISERHRAGDPAFGQNPLRKFAAQIDSTGFDVARIEENVMNPAAWGREYMVMNSQVPPVPVFPPAPTLAPLAPVMPAGGRDILRLDRFIWFTSLNPAAGNAHPQANRIFYNRFPNWDVSVAPGRYMMIGPRTQTTVGNRSDNDQNLVQKLTIKQLNHGNAADTGFAFTNVNGGPPAAPVVAGAPGIRSVVGMVAGANPPAAWTNTAATAPQGIGVNISEPLADGGSTAYYREPTDRLDASMPTDAYDDPTNPMMTTPDQPFDRGQMGTPLEGIVSTGSREDIRTVFLQRLADPTIPWHPVSNPYITVDWASLDLTVFNGEDRNPGATMGYDTAAMAWDPLDQDGANALTQLRMRGRERGQAGANLWPPRTTFPNIVPLDPTAAPEVYIPYQLRSTFGYLNSTMGNPRQVPLNFLGDPTLPFPWLAWNDRPFANPMETMLVPSSSPSRLMYEMPTTYPSNFPALPAMVNNTYDARNFHGQYKFLLNFFQSNGQVAPPPDQRAPFYRLFDLIETPSPFVGTERWYNPNAFVGGAGATTFRPPFNKLSRFRDPGRININTIFDERIWFGLCKGFPEFDSATFYNRVMRTRRGMNDAVPLFQLNVNFPTLFANPFRSSFSSDLMPNVPAGANSMRKLDGVEATLLRRRQNSNNPLFVPPDDPASPVLAQHRDQRRHPYFRYQGLARMSNLVTTNSNVFAVWLTVGYFEVEQIPTGPDNNHPDGYTLGRELGADTGNIVRHRAFYIIDRSVPVAFNPGENHNVDRAILLRRFIE